MEGSIFGRLPPELRNRIYHFVLVQDEPVVIEFVSRPILVKPTDQRHLIALTQTSTSVRKESRGILLGANNFSFDLGRRDMSNFQLDWKQEQLLKIVRLERWLRGVGEKTLRQMHTIDLAIGSACDWDGTYAFASLAPIINFISDRGKCIANHILSGIRSLTPTVGPLVGNCTISWRYQSISASHKHEEVRGSVPVAAGSKPFRDQERIARTPNTILSTLDQCVEADFARLLVELQFEMESCTVQLFH